MLFDEDYVGELVVVSSIVLALYFVVFLIADILSTINAIQYNYLSLSIYDSSIAYAIISLGFMFILFIKFGRFSKDYMKVFFAGLPFIASPIRALFMINLGVLSLGGVAIGISVFYDLAAILISGVLLFKFSKGAHVISRGSALFSLLFLYIFLLALAVFGRDVSVATGSLLPVSYGSYLHYGFYDYLTAFYGIALGMCGAKDMLSYLKEVRGFVRNLKDIQVHFKTGNYRKVVQMGGSAMTKIKSPKLVEKMKIVMAYSLYKDGDYEKAYSMIKDIEGWHGLKGDILLALGKKDEAEREYLEAIDKNPKDSSALVNLGMIYAERGDMERADEMFKKALEANKSNPVAWQDAAVMKIVSGRYEEALGMIKEAEKHVKAE